MDEIVYTDYGQLDIVWSGLGYEGDDDEFFRGQVNGLVGAANGGGVYLCLARRSGGSRVSVVQLDAAPPFPEQEFDDVVEVSVDAPDGAAVRWVSWAGETSGSLAGIPTGTLRLRASARGRDTGRDGEFADGVVDEYLLELWPATHAEDAIPRIGSEDARYWHQGRARGR
jgi:hypothetical protein